MLARGCNDGERKHTSLCGITLTTTTRRSEVSAKKGERMMGLSYEEGGAR